jgi:hypothetical protein
VTLSTGQLRTVWAPACKTKPSNPYGLAYAALDAWMRHFKYAVREKDTGAYNCRKITGGSGYSLHSYGPAAKFAFWTGVTIATSLAVDINWGSNPYGPRLITDMPRAMVDAIERVRTKNGKQVWRWGGYYAGNKDAMHFEIVCSPADLATGIDLNTLPGAPTAPPPAPVPIPPVLGQKEEDMGVLVTRDDREEWWLISSDGFWRRQVSKQQKDELLYTGLAKLGGNGGKANVGFIARIPEAPNSRVA